MDITINHGPDQKIFNFIEETVVFSLDANSHGPVGSPRNLNTVDSNNIDKYLNLVSTTKKLYFDTPSSIYHFFIDYIGKILKHAETYKNLELVISDVLWSRPTPGGSIYKDALELLKLHGIKITIVDASRYRGIIINNVFILDSYRAELGYEEALYNAALKVVRNKNIKPYRKVFLSRRQMGDRQHHSTAHLDVHHDNRIDDHDKIENYFKSLGYEIIIPEHFQSLTEQINYFYETKILVSTTSSGIVNAAFMQPGQTMIELQTPLIVYIPKQDQMANNLNNTPRDFSSLVAAEQLHFFYLKIAFQKQHKYIAINNKSRETNDIKKIIESDEYLKALICQSSVPSDTGANKKVKERRWFRR